MSATLLQGDCLDIMPTLPASSVDLVLCDLPYGTTQNKWDSVLPLRELWSAWSRVTKPGAATVLNCTQPFTSVLIASQLARFKYVWVWRKSLKTNFLNAHKQPLRCHEDIAVFCDGQTLYNAQGLADGVISGGNRLTKSYGTFGEQAQPRKARVGQTGWPCDVLDIPNGNKGNVHPTQKPVALMEYLIRTYTNPGDTVLDNCMGSGTTGVACLNTGRNFIGIEKDPGYFAIAERRIREAEAQLGKAGQTWVSLAAAAKAASEKKPAPGAPAATTETGTDKELLKKALDESKPGETVTAGPAATAAPAKQVVTLQRPLQAPRLAGPAVVGPAGSATSDFTPTLPVVDGGVAPSSKPE